jgi:HAD superfamily hydrolase (TIGR01484 family)
VTGTDQSAGAARMGVRGPSVRLVALDLDGTILEAGQHIAPAVVLRLRGLVEHGVRCVPATGRPLDFQLQLFHRHGLGGSGVPSALMVDEREIFLPHDGALSPPAVSGAGQLPAYQPLQPWNDAVRRRWRDLHPGAMAWLDRAYREARRRGWQAEQHLSAEEAAARGLPTLQLANPAEAAAICEWLERELATATEPLACNRNVRQVQIYDARVGKGPVLAEIARMWNIPAPQVLAVGDSLNDRSMLDARFGFRTATVGNADVLIKALVTDRGGYVAAARAGEGVLETLGAYNIGTCSAGG